MFINLHTGYSNEYGAKLIIIKYMRNVIRKF